MIAEEETLPPFKRASLTNNAVGVKKRLWKSLKQITSTERTLQWSDDAVTCKLSRREENRISLSFTFILLFQTVQ